MLIYILEVTLCWSAFYLLYRFWLRQETFFQTNRWYLLGTILVGLLVPLISWQPNPETVYHTGMELFDPVHQSLYQFDHNIQVVAQRPNWNWLDALLLLYVLGVVVMSYRFLYGLVQIGQLYRGSQVEQQGKIKMVYTRKKHLPFSF